MVKSCMRMHASGPLQSPKPRESRGHSWTQGIEETTNGGVRRLLKDAWPLQGYLHPLAAWDPGASRTMTRTTQAASSSRTHFIHPTFPFARMKGRFGLLEGRLPERASKCSMVLAVSAPYLFAFAHPEKGLGT